MENGISVPVSAQDLRTHMVVLGSSGSGKSGLVLGVVEDLLKQQVPVILVDIKGDMVNIAIRDYSLDYSVRCLTPGAIHGTPINLLGDLKQRSPYDTAVAVLRFLGERTDIQSPHLAFLAEILTFRAEEDEYNLAHLVLDVQDPPVHYCGAMPINDVLPKRKRLLLAAQLNNLLLPEYLVWGIGQRLDLDVLMAGEKTPVLVYSVAHLVDQDQQAFALGLFFEEFLRWTKSQSSHEGLRAALVVDECVGLLPPYPANPPTKAAILTLLKQARAFGVGIILATQNPVDLDYKAVSNCSSWVIGRLATEQDRARVVKGLGLDSIQESKIAKFKPREFLFVSNKTQKMFRTRDTLCSLAGPMTPTEISDLYEAGLLDGYEVVSPSVEALVEHHEENGYASITVYGRGTDLPELHQETGPFAIEETNQWSGIRAVWMNLWSLEHKFPGAYYLEGVVNWLTQKMFRRARSF